jgi:hypothetical protein
MRKAWNYVEIEAGTRFGQLVVVEETSTDRQNRRFKCLCDCGKEHETSYACLRYGKSKSCGCLKIRETIERHNSTRGSTVVGLANGSWVVFSYSGRTYNCRCEVCGNEKSFNESSFKCGGISSCCRPVSRNHVYYKRSLRTCIGMAIGKHYKKTQKSADMLGMPIDEVLKHIESLWQPGMSWKNKGKRGPDGWDIDHICPCSQAQNEEELIKLQHYTNLRPMWAIDNRTKNDFKTPEGEDVCQKLLGREWIDKPKWYNL